MSIIKSGIDIPGEGPSIGLINPRYSMNVAKVVRLASCYDMTQVWFTGNRIQTELLDRTRLPREERMKGYKNVQLIQYDRIIDQFPNAVPVAVEVSPNAELLPYFEHPENALYLFGPEDGYIPRGYMSVCHRFVTIPVSHCLNLATAVATVLWDRKVKRIQMGLEECTTMAESLKEDRGWVEPDSPNPLFTGDF